MKTILVALATFLLSLSAAAEDYQIAVNKALAAGDTAAIVKALEKEIFRGNIVAAQHLGLLYRDGKQVKQDYALARKWLEVAATYDWKRMKHKRGLADAQYALGMMLRDGVGASPDIKQAAHWLNQAADQGDAQAQLTLAKLHMDGKGIKQDIEQAFVWASIAANWLTEAAKTEAELLRDLAQKQLNAKQLEKAEKLVSAWTPRTL